MTYHEIFAILTLMTALASFFNDRYLKLPKTIALIIVSGVIAVVVGILRGYYPYIVDPIHNVITSVDFKTTILDLMLGYLLFASSLHVDAVVLKKYAKSVVYLASVGVLISTFITGYSLWLLLQYFSINIPLGQCLVFGALISPTDAIAVLSVFKTVTNVPERLKMVIIGEGLFNDAAGITLLFFLSGIVFFNQPVTLHSVSTEILRDAGGGAIFGWILGYITEQLLKRTKNAEVATLLTIAACSFGYVMSYKLHLSGVITVVVEGLVIGFYSRKHRLSARSSLVVVNFWELVDEILNAFLFMLIGLAMLTIEVSQHTLVIGVSTVVIILFARFCSIWIPHRILAIFWKKERKHIFTDSILLTWGGIRGGISIALALSISGLDDDLVAIAYVAVVSSILLQGSTFKWAIKYFLQKQKLS